MSQAKRTSAALPGHRHFHVFRTRLQKWPRLFSSWSKAAKKRRLLFQALSHFCMYLSLSACVHVYSVNATKHRWCLYENEKKKGRSFASLLPRFSSSTFFSSLWWGCRICAKGRLSQNREGWTDFWRSGVSCCTKSSCATWTLSKEHIKLCTDALRIKQWIKGGRLTQQKRKKKRKKSLKLPWSFCTRKWCFHLRSSWQKKNFINGKCQLRLRNTQ